jgi:ADP-heptose:LPS heptosyltransferase
MKRILIISLQGIGNTILLFPIIQCLGKDTGIEISMVTSDSGSGSLAENNPYISMSICGMKKKASYLMFYG